MPLSSICNRGLGVHSGFFKISQLQIQKEYNHIKMTFYTSNPLECREQMAGHAGAAMPQTWVNISGWQGGTEICVAGPQVMSEDTWGTGNGLSCLSPSLQASLQRNLFRWAGGSCRTPLWRSGEKGYRAQCAAWHRPSWHTCPGLGQQRFPAQHLDSEALKMNTEWTKTLKLKWRPSENSDSFS